jgi:hypothetical protein
MTGWGSAERWERGRSLFHGLKVRIAATLGLFVGGLVWILLYAAFWAGHFSWFQNLAIILTTLITVPVAVVAMWVMWGIGVGRRMRSWVDDRFDL